MSDAVDDGVEFATPDAIRIVRLDQGHGAVDEVLEQLDRRAAGLRVTAVTDPDEVRRLVEHEPVDCVVADWDVAGDAFLRALRADGHEVPCVAVADDAGETDRALEAGATDVVGPADRERPGLVASRVEQFATGHRARRRSADEGELRREARLLEQLFEQIPAALYVKDTDGRHVRMSDYDVDPAAVVGKTDPEIYGDTEFARESHADDLRVVETGEPVVNKEEYNPETGEWTLTSKVPWYDDDGDVQGLIGVSRLITEKKEFERELERTNERLEEFAGIVGHDLRAPLNVAHGHLRDLADDVDDPRLERVDSSLSRIEALVDDLLALARQGRTIDEVREVPLDAVVEDAWASVETGDATLAVEGERVLLADRSRLRELFENLLRNAVEHGSTSPDGVDASDGDAASEDADGTATPDSADDALHVRVGTTDDGFFVADDGVGIPPADRDAVFEAGVTTAEDGTGFGLSIVEEVASAHDWSVSATESRDGGARFEVTGVEFVA